MKYCFHALLEEDEREPGFTIISFPDLIGIGSECEKGKEMETTREILGLALITEYRRLIHPTDVEILKKYYPDCEVILVEVNVDEDDVEERIL